MRVALLSFQAEIQVTLCTALLQPSELMILTRNDFLGLLERESRLSIQIMQLLCQRIRWASGLAEDSALLEVPARLARRLLSLAKLHGHNTRAGAHLRISQEEMARFLGLSSQIVNQHLPQWKREGWIDLCRGNMTITNLNALEAIAAGE
jgi:CRP-like cAMP-binding protein